MATFASRLATALEMNSMKASELSRKTKISEASISQYLRGTFVPKADKVYLMASALNVTPNWLLAYDEPDERLLQVEVSTLFLSLPSDLQQQAVEYLYFLKKQAEKRVTPNTMKGYSAAYKKISDRWGDTPVEEMTPQSIADWLKTYSNYANKTIKNILLVLRLILDYGCNNFGLQYNPALRLKAPKGRGKQEREFPDEEDIRIVRDNVTHEFGLMPYMALYTGLRRGELCAPQWKDVDFETNTIHVTKSVYWSNDHVPHIKSPKSKAGTRDVPLIDSLSRILLPLKKKPADYILGLPHSYQIDDGMEKYRKDTGLKCTLHGLRHGYASILYSLGVDIKTASYVLGHAQTSTTMEIYTHLMEEDKISSVRDALNANTH